MRKLIWFTIVFGLWSGAVLAGPQEDAAVASGKVWLAIVDAKDYGGSWDQASQLFQSGVSKERWMSMVASVRERLGALKSREFEAVELTKSLPGVPDGVYAMVRFQAVFEKKADAAETITLVLENSNWKVGGYFIK